MLQLHSSSHAVVCALLPCGGCTVRHVPLLAVWVLVWPTVVLCCCCSVCLSVLALGGLVSMDDLLRLCAEECSTVMAGFDFVAAQLDRSQVQSQVRGVLLAASRGQHWLLMVCHEHASCAAGKGGAKHGAEAGWWRDVKVLVMCVQHRCALNATRFQRYHPKEGDWLHNLSLLQTWYAQPLCCQIRRRHHTFCSGGALTPQQSSSQQDELVSYTCYVTTGGCVLPAAVPAALSGPLYVCVCAVG